MPGLIWVQTVYKGYYQAIKFCGFFMGRNQYYAGRVYDLCVYYMTGTPEGSTESGFMEKPEIDTILAGTSLYHLVLMRNLY